MDYKPMQPFGRSRGVSDSLNSLNRKRKILSFFALEAPLEQRGRPVAAAVSRLRQEAVANFLRPQFRTAADWQEVELSPKAWKNMLRAERLAWRSPSPASLVLPTRLRPWRAIRLFEPSFVK
eukprot:TRINITY_DN3161_c0_g1_i3.p4 TRINITY_DN3161_c0_g1~~TRINITY_DN3161_c0_g1_i3.p4  ORF type:complete len:122 (-),score=17.80 TRINITY_DN3161_c0_g1_i3:148-513(-)